MTWTEERLLKLRECIDKKLSAGVTADILGLNRNQVVGKAHRLGLKFKSVAGHNQLPQGNQGWRPVPKPVSQQPLEAEHVFLGFDLKQLNDHTCKYPYGDSAPFLFCGQPTDEPPYCSHCRSLCYREPPPRGGQTIPHVVGISK